MIRPRLCAGWLAAAIALTAQPAQACTNQGPAFAAQTAFSILLQLYPAVEGTFTLEQSQPGEREGVSFHQQTGTLVLADGRRMQVSFALPDEIIISCAPSPVLPWRETAHGRFYVRPLADGTGELLNWEPDEQDWSASDPAAL